MAKKSIKKLLLTTCCAAMLVVGSVATCFAADFTNTTEGQVDATLAVPSTSIDFSIIPEDGATGDGTSGSAVGIDMTGTANSTDLDVTNLTVQNNSAVGVINISSIAIACLDGWSLDDMDATWEEKAANTQQFGLQTENWDFYNGAFTAGGDVAPGESDVTEFVGKSGMRTTTMDRAKVADVVITVGYN